ncbi:hypothetical protein BRC66_07750 [Halobacteriales archaeon QH_2_66_30]|nr:MAG: hypothetical protein BRC66_07750 [Halobacteriales archaeon QH_2_66_30]
MMVGHAALAFAIAAWVSHRYGFEAERALLVGAAAGAFAVVPDVDMGYALVGLATAGTVDPSVLQETFWDSGLTVHRGMTHSLVVAGVAGVGFGLLAYRDSRRLAGLGLLTGMVVATGVFLGVLETGVMASFVLAGVVVAIGARRAGVEPESVLAAALVGVLSHPFGDLFTGTAPKLLYPFDVRLLPTRVTLSADPTLHLLGAFATELATVWLAFAVYMAVRGRPLRGHVHRRAILGAGYAAAVLAFPPPTLSVSYHFVFSVLAVGVVCGSVDVPTPDLRCPETRRTVLLTSLTAITVALVAYAAAYLIVTYRAVGQTV